MRYLSDLVTLELDESVCPHAVFRIEERKAVIADRGACMECGACARNCEPGALRVRAGVGCAFAALSSAARGREPGCGCSGGGSGS